MKEGKIPSRQRTIAEELEVEQSEPTQDHSVTEISPARIENCLGEI